MWIKSRVQNRRFPESTVIETYRLYELGFHLQMAEQLPGGATMDISDRKVEEMELDEDQFRMHEHVQGKGYISFSP